MSAKINFQNVALKISAGFPAQFPRDARPRIAFSGRSNAGKSSLINALLGRKDLARVSSAPGKTITVNFYDIDGKLYFVDLPGYGFAKRPDSEKKKWSALTDGFFVNNPDTDMLRLVVQLVDIRHDPTEDDRMMLNFLRESNLPYLVVASKADKISPTAARAAINRLKDGFPGISVLAFSALNGEGRDILRKKILKAAFSDAEEAYEP